ncbi:MAG: hypothetical protein MRERC_1c186 [Mycoplasmataceae bacterium RC_NB112A]|nr:MAG: hypothetical protein MRERC_1c186 [Mycoplasmataceae bacterium RC_NB112A]
MKEFTKIGEEMLESTRESCIDKTESELELANQKTVLATIKNKLKTPNIKSVGEAWLVMEKIKWGN